MCVTAWVTPAAATAFFQSYHQLLAVQYPGGNIEALEDQSGHLWYQAQTHGLLRRQARFGHRVAGALAADRPRLQALLERVTAGPAPPR